MKIELDNLKYRELRERKKDIIFAHCRNCYPDMPDDYNPAAWSNLEAIIDLRTGFLTIGCKRCKLPIVTAMMPSDIINHMNGCGCELCRSRL